MMSDFSVLLEIPNIQKNVVTVEPLINGDALGTGILSFIERLSSLQILLVQSICDLKVCPLYIERLSSLQRLKCTSTINIGRQSVSPMEKLFFYCVLYSVYPSSEVLLHKLIFLTV